MSMVTLVSGGLDSTVMSVLARDEGVEQYPLFINYGQLSAEAELRACRANMRILGIVEPEVLSIGGVGELIACGLTDRTKRIYEDAFLPCRNLLFLTLGAAYAYQCGANSVAIGLLDEKYSLFPDQTRSFIEGAERQLTAALGRPLRVLTPLMRFSKKDVVALAKSLGITGTYSCHAGGETPCGVCVACREYIGTEA